MTVAELTPEAPVITAPLAPPEATAKAAEPIRHLAIICSKGSLDMAYPGLILANAARMSGIDATLFFTFWGLDILNAKKVDHLHVATVGNPSLPLPTLLGSLPGMETLTTAMMKKQMEEIDIPGVREMIEILHASGAKLYACKMAMDMFKLTREDLVPEVEAVISAMDFFDQTAGAQLLFI
jgi:peroxiredoxin family protein